MEKEKVFVIINSYFVGDIILVNSLVQNIKRIFKNSKVVMLTSPKLVDVAKNQQGVDDVVIWDRHGEHHGFFGTLKFLKAFPYKNVFASFPIYGMDRPVMLSHMLGAKNVLFGHWGKKSILKHLHKSKYKINKLGFNDSPVQNFHLNLLSGVTKEELIDCKIKYLLDGKTFPELDLLQNDFGKYITLCPISSRPSKDMPYDTIVNIIKNIKQKVVVLGGGAVSRTLSEKLKEENLENLIDLANKTTLDEAVKIIAKSKATISVDTGLMHLAYSVDKPVVGVFYEVKNSPFMPDEKMYKSKMIFENQTAENILSALEELCN